MENLNINIGKTGEDYAVEFLQQKGYQILERNWRSGSLEVDIIALQRDILVFVEVKSRSANYLLPPQNAVTKSKQRNIITAAARYVEYKSRTEEVRFDIISVVMKQGQVADMEHIEAAYYPTLR